MHFSEFYSVPQCICMFLYQYHIVYLGWLGNMSKYLVEWVCLFSAVLFHDCLNQGSGNCSPWAKPCPLTIFVNKALLEHNHMHLLTYHLRLLLSTTTAELSSCILPPKPKIFIVSSFFYRKSLLTPGLGYSLTWILLHKLQNHFGKIPSSKFLIASNRNWFCLV